jgi:hypothetical protein
MSRGGGWGNAWPTEVAEGWLPEPAIIFAQYAMRSQSSGAQNFGLVGSDTPLQRGHAIGQAPRETADEGRFSISAEAL